MTTTKVLIGNLSTLSGQILLFELCLNKAVNDLSQRCQPQNYHIQKLKRKLQRYSFLGRFSFTDYLMLLEFIDVWAHQGLRIGPLWEELTVK